MGDTPGAYEFCGILETTDILPQIFRWFCVFYCGKLALGQLENPGRMGGRKRELIFDTFLRQETPLGNLCPG